MAKNKKKDAKPEKKHEEKQVVTVKIPSLGPKFLIILLAIGLAVSLYFNFNGVKGSGNLSLSGLAYLCPPGNCDISQVKEWAKDVGYSTTSYEAPWARVPVGLIFEGKTVQIVDVSSKSNFYSTVCDATKNTKACEVSKIEEQKQAQQSCETMKKQDKVQLDAFVVSYCPFGLQMQRILVPVHQLFGSKVDITVRYIGEIVDGKITAMHGDQEAQENLKQICIREEQPDKYWDYVSCFMKEAGKSDACTVETKIDKAKLDSCMKDPKRGLKYAQVDFDLQNKYGVSGSPTLIQNGERASEFNFGGRTAEAVKTMICCGMKSKLPECDTKLSTDQANTAFSPTYSSGGGSSTGSGAQC